MLTDTHAHLYWESYKSELDQVLQKCRESQVQLIINVGTDIATSLQAIEMTKKLKTAGFSSYSTVGIHPHDGEKYNSDVSIHQSIKKLKELVKTSPNIIAVGECGLDYHSHVSTPVSPEAKVNQMRLYQAQVELAQELTLPVIIHCRDAWPDIFLSQLTGITGVFHNFTGSLVDAKKAIELGFYLSFSCILTYPKNQILRDLLAEIPLTSILTETDCPFLPPQHIRGQRNDPSFIPEVVKIIAQAKSRSEAEVANQIWKNTQALFNIS